MADVYIKIEHEPFDEEEYKDLREYWTGLRDWKDASLPGGMSLRRRRMHTSRIAKYPRFVWVRKGEINSDNLQQYFNPSILSS